MSALKKVYDAKNAADAQVLRSVLEAESIPAVVRGVGSVPFIESGLFRIGSRPSVWVLDDGRLARALEIVHGYRTDPEHAASAAAGHQAPAAAWTCPSCGERLEQQFSDCWSCGAPRPPD